MSYNTYYSILQKAAAGRRQLKRKRVEIKDKHQGGGGHYTAVLPRQNDGVALAGLLSAASRGDSSVLRGFLDLYSGGNSSHRNQQSIVEELIHLSNMRRMSQDNIHSTRSTVNNMGSYSPDDYGMDLFDDYNITPGSGSGSYNNGTGSGVHLPNRVSSHAAAQRDWEFRNAFANHNAGCPPYRNHPQPNSRYSAPFPEQQQQQLVGGRSSSQAIDLCDDDSGFSVLSSSFPPRQYPSASFRRIGGPGVGQVPLFGRHATNFSGNAHTQAVDLTDDVIDLREDSSVVREDSSVVREDSSVVREDSSVVREDCSVIREDDSSALGDVWAVSDMSSSSSSSSTAATTTTSSSSITSSLPLPLTINAPLTVLPSNSPSKQSSKEIPDLGIIFERSAS